MDWIHCILEVAFNILYKHFWLLKHQLLVSFDILVGIQKISVGLRDVHRTQDSHLCFSGAMYGSWAFLRGHLDAHNQSMKSYCRGRGVSLRLRLLNEVSSVQVSAYEPSISTSAILNRDFASAVSEALERNVAVIGIYLKFSVWILSQMSLFAW